MGKREEPALKRLEASKEKIKEEQKKARTEIKNLYFLHFAGRLTDAQSKRLQKAARGFPKPSAVTRVQKRSKKPESSEG